MRPPVAWAAGLGLSAMLHAAVAAIVVPLYAPKDPPRQPPPETRLDMETVAAPRQDAAARDPETEQAAEGRAQGTDVGADVVPRSDARPVAATAERRAATAPRVAATEAADPSGIALSAAAPDAGRVTAAAPAAQTLAATAPVTARLPEAPPPPAQAALSAQAATTSLPAGDPAPETVVSAALSPDRLAAADPATQALGAATPTTTRLTETPGPAAQTLSVAEPVSVPLDAARPAGDAVPPAEPSAQTLAATLPATSPTTASPPDTPPAPLLVAAAMPADALVPAATASPPLAVAADVASPRAATASALPAAPATGQTSAALAPPATPLPQSRPDAATAAEAEPPATSARATLAWQFGDRVVTDPQALATIQAFMAPAALDDAAAVKDDLASVLTGIDCARLSATFLPETGTLEMRGHIPDPALQGPILAALRAQVGDGIPVTANLRHLPAPQCGALTGISEIGLPQSTDQFTNDRLVGKTAHAREYTYTEGQRLQFDLTAPDYDAFVYVDYFNADGEVIHLVPNDTIALEKHAAKTVLGVGQDRPGLPGLRITIGPPFGQEIAVAFAASHPLYDGLRPIIEPAGPYLDALQSLVAAARADHPDFKGEWVYFFITTAPATQ